MKFSHPDSYLIGKINVDSPKLLMLGQGNVRTNRIHSDLMNPLNHDRITKTIH